MGHKGGFVLQSEPHESLFNGLLDITSRVRRAVHERDLEALRLLAKEHDYVMDKLNRAGFSKDPDLLDLIKEVHDNVGGIIAKIGKMRDEIGRELRTFVERKEMVNAYASGIYSVRPRPGAVSERKGRSDTILNLKKDITF
jgi:hypothetical protein